MVKAASSAHAAADGQPDQNFGALPPRLPLRFFLLVFALSVPFWLVGAVFDVHLLPGLPLSALSVVCPLVAAGVLVYKDSQRAGVVALVKRSFDFKRTPAMGWSAATLLLAPAVSLIVYGLMRCGGWPLPSLQLSAHSLLLMFLAFFAAALSEELGWSGYALEPLQRRWHALPASFILGLVTALWHAVPLLRAQRSLTWMAWWCLYAVAARVLMVWLYNHTGQSLFAAALFHTMLNLSWMLFPVQGSYFDPRLAGLVMGFVAIAAVLVWGPKLQAPGATGKRLNTRSVR